MRKSNAINLTGLWAAGLAALILPMANANPIGPLGLGEMNIDAEYLFGYSNYGTDNTLTINGSTVLSTGDSRFNPWANNQGWWSATDSNGDYNDNYIVGDLSDNGTSLLNNFFTFDISGLSGPVSSATLNLRRYEGWSDTGRTFQQYRLYDVSTEASKLNYNEGTSAAIFNDLGSGKLYGSYAISVSGDSDEILNLSLNDDAIADLNAAINQGNTYFSIGGTLPEAGSTLAMLGAVAGLLGWFRRRSQ